MAQTLERRAEYMRAYHERRKTDPVYLANRAKAVDKWKAGNRSAIAMYKLERGCADCGYSEDPVALDFDHVRGTKTGNVSKMEYSLDAMLDEIEKCDVVCANCHRVRTANRR